MNKRTLHHMYVLYCTYTQMKSCILLKSRQTKLVLLVSMGEWQTSYCYKWQPPLSQFIPVRISWRGHKSMWPLAFDVAFFWLFIYSSKERGVKMPAHMTVTDGKQWHVCVCVLYMCVFLCAPHLKHTHYWQGCSPEACQKLQFKNQLPFSKRNIFHQTLGLNNTLYSKCPHPISPVSTYHNKLDCKTVNP